MKKLIVKNKNEYKNYYKLKSYSEVSQRMGWRIGLQSSRHTTPYKRDQGGS